MFVLHSVWEEKIHSSVRERKRERREGWWKEFHGNKDPTRGGVVLSPRKDCFWTTLFVATLTEIQYRRPNGAAATTEKGLSYVSQHGVEMTDVMSPCLLSKLHVRGISCSVWLLTEPRIPLLIGSQCRRSRRQGGGGGRWGGGEGDAWPECIRGRVCLSTQDRSLWNLSPVDQWRLSRRNRLSVLPPCSQQ